MTLISVQYIVQEMYAKNVANSSKNLKKSLETKLFFWFCAKPSLNLKSTWDTSTSLKGQAPDKQFKKDPT